MRVAGYTSDRRSTRFPRQDRPDHRARHPTAPATDYGYAVAATGVPGRHELAPGLGEFAAKFHGVQTPMATYSWPPSTSAAIRRPCWPREDRHRPAIAAAVRRAFGDAPRITAFFEDASAPCGSAGGVHDRRHVRRAGDPPRGAGTRGLRLESPGCRIRASDRA